MKLIEKNDRATLRALLREEGAVAACSELDSGFPIAWNAVIRGDRPDLVSVLLEAGVDTSARTLPHYSGPLTFALIFERAKMAQQLLSAGIGGNEVTESNHETPMHLAAAYCHELIAPLADAGFAVDAVDDRGWSPFLFAAFQGQHKAIEVLLACGADSSRLDADGDSALALAAGSALRALERVAEGARPEDQRRLDRLERTISLLRERQIGVDERARRALRKFEKARDASGSGGAKKDPWQALVTPEALARKGWAAEVAKRMGPAWKKRKELERLASVVLSAPGAIAHAAWPDLVLKLLACSETYRAATKRTLGKFVAFGDDGDAGMFDAWGDGHFVTVDLVAGVLSSKEAVAHPRWGELVLATIEAGVAFDFPAPFDEVLRSPAARKHPALASIKAAKTALEGAASRKAKRGSASKSRPQTRSPERGRVTFAEHRQRKTRGLSK